MNAPTVMVWNVPLDNPAGCVVLCEHCERQRSAAIGGPELERCAAQVISGVCHDCGGGWCLCGGRLPCNLCPRRNSPVIVAGLSLFVIVAPPDVPTVPALGGGA